MKRSKTKVSAQSKLKKIDNRMSFFTFLAIALLIWQMSIYRKTFIDILIPLSILIVGGLSLFFILRKRINYYKNFRFGILIQSIHGLILFGSYLVFLFMALNFILPSKAVQRIQLKIQKEDRFGESRRSNSIGDPYAIVNYKGIRKQLVFPKRTVLRKGDYVNLKIKKGLFGFYIVDEMKPASIYSDVSMIEEVYDAEEKQKLKIINAAEKCWKKGDIDCAIDYYKRAVNLFPSDEGIQNRLSELKKKNEPSGNTSIKTKYLFEKKNLQIIEGELKGNPLKSTKILKKLTYEKESDYYEDNSIYVQQITLKLTNGTNVEFLENQTKNKFETLIFYNKQQLKIEKLYGEMFSKESEIYFHYDTGKMYLLTNGNLLFVEQPAAWCGTANQFDFYQLIDIHNKRVVQFVEKDEFIKKLK
jgi:hypothetical protein